MAKYINEIFNNVKLKAEVIEIYDGDTITVKTNFPGVWTRSENDLQPLPIKFKLRMIGYDCAEKRTKNKNEKRMSLIARQALCDKILNKEVDLECKSLDKYGRLLAIVKHNGENVNDFMVKKNYAYVYGGKTKAKVEYNDDDSYCIEGKKYIMGKEGCEDV